MGFAPPLAVLSHLPEHLQQRLRAELRSGETVAWAGQPDPQKAMKVGFALWVFFIPWTGFSLFMMDFSLDMQVPYSWGNLALTLFGLPFLLAGVWGLSAPWRLRRNAASTVYAITSERALTIEGVKTIQVRSFNCGDRAALKRVERQDGSGDLIFLTEHYVDSEGDKRSTEVGFKSIPDVRKVAMLAEALQARLRKAAGAI